MFDKTLISHRRWWLFIFAHAFILIFVGYLGVITTTTTKKIKNYANSYFEKSSMFVRNYKQKVVVIYSNQRSGSSFVGEMFSHHPDTFYLFEPLYPFTPKCQQLVYEREEFLRQLLQCNFLSIRENYKNISKKTNIIDAARCVEKSLCFIGKNSQILQKYIHACMKVKLQLNSHTNFPTSNECAFPLRGDIISSICKNSPLLVYKVIRLCSLSGLNDIYHKLKQLGLDMYVIHLVRDPRAITSSRLKLRYKRETVENIAIPLCYKMYNNLVFAQENSEMIKDNKYLRIRYENVASTPLQAAQQLYDFTGTDLVDNVKTWIEETTNPQSEIQSIQEQLLTNSSYHMRSALHDRIIQLRKKMNNPFSTVRQSSSVLERWRRTMNFDKTRRVQDACKNTMDLLGYKKVFTNLELQQYETPLWH